MTRIRITITTNATRAPSIELVKTSGPAWNTGSALIGGALISGKKGTIPPISTPAFPRIKLYSLFAVLPSVGVSLVMYARSPVTIR